MMEIIFLILKRGKYLFISLLVAGLTFVLSYFLTVWNITGKSISAYATMSGWGFTLFSLFLSLIISALFGIYLSLFLARRQLVRVKEENNKIASAGGVASGLLAAGCPTCGAPLFALLGAPLALFSLPFNGLELKVLSVVLLSLSVYLLLENIKSSLFAASRQTNNYHYHMIKNNNQKTKKIMRWIIGAVMIIGAVYGLIVLLRQSVGESVGQTYPILGKQHISVGASHPNYNSNPPTSGWHYAASAGWGVYENELPDEQIVHNLEHGGIWIAYKEINEATKEQLEKIGRANSGIIVTPRQANDAPIALVSWGKLQKLELFDETAIMNFIKANKNRSPEPLAP